MAGWRIALVTLLCGVLTAGRLNAQVPVHGPADSARAEISTGKVVLAGIIGSAAGLTAGFVGGGQLGWGGGDDPGLAGAVLFAGIGSVLGTAAGIHVASNARVPFATSLGAGALGVLAGIGGAVIFNAITDGWIDDSGVVIGYSISQGAVTGVVSSYIARN